ncbi:hypothetical protein B0H14DRAFT_3470306 [Mycena olivaceomarginata]|nr:hypothetical protein B0H14DRAFT_3470306 [Mycena olivaceomarginata]
MTQHKDSNEHSNSSTFTLTEEEWQELLQMLQRKLREYNRAKTQGDEEAVKRLAREIEQLMRKLADSHSDPAKRASGRGPPTHGLYVAFLIASAALYVAGAFALTLGPLPPPNSDEYEVLNERVLLSWTDNGWNCK